MNKKGEALAVFLGFVTLVGFISWVIVDHTTEERRKKRLAELRTQQILSPMDEAERVYLEMKREERLISKKQEGQKWIGWGIGNSGKK